MVLHRRVWLAGSIATAAVLAVVATALLLSARIGDRAEALDARAQADVLLSRSELYVTQSQQQVEAAALHPGAGSATTVLQAYSELSRGIRFWGRYTDFMLAHGGLPAHAAAVVRDVTASQRLLARDSQVASAGRTSATNVTVAKPAAHAVPAPTPASRAGATVAAIASRAALAQQIDTDLALVRMENATWWTAHVDILQRAISQSIRWLITASLLALVLTVGSHALLGRVARRRDQELAERDRDLAGVASANEFEARLQRALELSPSEERVFAVVEQAMDESVPELGVELLLADSSRAHFERVMTTGGNAGAARIGCSVDSPGRCPAAQRGEVLIFESSLALDACPYLTEAPAPCSAVCVPVSVSGTTVGVMHATGAVDAPPSPDGRTALELVARRASDRIGMMRAFSRSEVEATTDALTGLLNRRALENSARRLVAGGTPYVVGFADLDHFKAVNDRYGHGAGDQALRVFSRVLRDCVRPHDLCARYGGEEFVVVLPDCDLHEAERVFTRIRETLAATLVSADCPVYTSSFGLAMGERGEAFGSVVGRADAALLEAKRLGRDRVVVSEATAVDIHLVPQAGAGPALIGHTG